MNVPDTLLSVRAAVSALHPSGRRWLRFLGSLPLDPDLISRPVEPPGSEDFVICGAPRTGTTLLSAMLFQPPRILTVMEPWDGMRLPPAQLFASLRGEIEGGSMRRGKLDIDALLARGEVRRVAESSSVFRVSGLRPGYKLGVKWPAFWRYLDLLPDTRFLVCVRNPLEVIASFKREGGRLRRGLDYDIAFNRSVNRDLSSGVPSAAARRVALYDRVNATVLRNANRPNVKLVRYERWFSDRKGLEAEIGDFLGVPAHRGVVRLRAPRSAEAIGERERAFIAKHCTTAGSLGYRVG